MAKPCIDRADRALALLRRDFDSHRAPTNFDSSKCDGARQKAAFEIAHRQIRAAQNGAMVTGFETAETLQRCDGLRDIFIDPTVHPDNKPAPQAAA